MLCAPPSTRSSKKAILIVLTSTYNWQLFVIDSTPHSKSSNCLMQHLAQLPLGQKRSIPQTKNDTKYKVLTLKHIP